MLAQSLDFLGRRHRRRPVSIGATYRRRAADNTFETARVLSMHDDDQGIAHVRFHVNISCGPDSYVDEIRILSLKAFAQRYDEKVEG